MMFEKQKDPDTLPKPDETITESEPIEPARIKLTRLTWIRWFVFFLFVFYVLLSHYHATILTAVGRYLIVDHPLEPADLIVCLAGSNIERGLETAEIYHMGMAPRVFITREQPLDGYFLLQERGLDYTQNVDLLKKLLEDLGVPLSAILTDDTPVDSTLAEAKLIQGVVQEGHYRSLIIVTSPFHTKRTFLTFKKVLDNMDVQIRMRYSRYSEFRSEDWWKNRRFLRLVIIEYQKLIYYLFNYLL
jgi:uncharacterized SAM-binding protein YcdF (DUF218 family)